MRNLNFILVIVTALFIVITVSACKSEVAGPDTTKAELPRELTPSEKQLVKADQSFSYDIFRRTVSYDDEENVFISPLSLSMALAMTLNGAESETFEEMKNTLSLNNMNLEEINEAFQSLMELLVSVDPDVQLTIANSIWHEASLPVKEDFLERVKDRFDAKVTGLDFSNPESVNVINSWVSENTGGRIEEIISEIPPEIVLYLINAIYFKGDWLSQFDPDDTRKTEFYLENGETVTVDMMNQRENFAVHFSDEVRMIELPYGDSLFTMTVLMPGSNETPIDQFVEEKMTAENLADWRSNMSVSNVPLQLPRFEMEYEITYNDVLKAMGMERAFNKTLANFTGIADVSPQNLFISEVKHKTFLRVDEEGTEAAAVTSVGVGVTSMPPSMIVNRPFVLLIYERESGTNLFMGKVKNPVL